MHKHRALMSLCVVSALFLAGCGDGDDDGGAGGTTAPTSGAPTTTVAGGPTTTAGGGGATTVPAKDPAKAAKAAAAVFQASDFPPGFAPQPPDEGLGLDTIWADLTRCLGVDTTADRAAAATSDTWLRGLATQARSTVEYTTASSSAAVATALAGPRFQQCATDAFAADVKRSAPEGGVPGPVEIAPLDVPTPGPRISAYRVNVTINMQELQVPLFQDFLVVFDGEALIRMLFLNPGSAFPPELERTLVEKVVARA